jgi:hypothetical protein
VENGSARKSANKSVWAGVSFLVVMTVGLSAAFFFLLFAKRDPACRKPYAALTKDGALVVTVVFGYKDSRPTRFVGDRYERAMFSDYLLRTCQGDEVVCGFTPDPNNAEFFSKKILWYDGKERAVQVQVLTSSVGPDDEWNRNSSLQSWNSDRTRRLFRKALAFSDIVFYNGHSRVGGGPDFFPPKIFKSGMIQYDYYQAARPGLKDLLADLEATKKARQPRLLGVFSCASNKHFQQSILDTKPKLGLIASQALLYQSDAMENMVAGLSAVLRGECEAAFTRRLRSTDPSVGSTITGFF